MRTIVFLLLFPALLFAKDEYSLLIDGVKNGNDPGLIIALFVESPCEVLDTIGWRPVSATENEPVTRKILRGRVIEQDSTGRYLIIEKDFQVNWALADTLLNVSTTLADSNVVMKMKFISGLFLPATTVLTKELIDSDSVWRANR